MAIWWVVAKIHGGVDEGGRGGLPDGSRNPGSPVITTWVEPGEEAGTIGGCGGGRSVAAITVTTKGSIVICLNTHEGVDEGGGWGLPDDSGTLGTHHPGGTRRRGWY